MIAKFEDKSKGNYTEFEVTKESGLLLTTGEIGYDNSINSVELSPKQYHELVKFLTDKIMEAEK